MTSLFLVRALVDLVDEDRMERVDDGVVLGTLDDLFDGDTAITMDLVI